MGAGLVDRFGHLAILEDNGKTVHYYYNEWKPRKPFTIEAQGRPVLTNSFDSGEDAIRELLRRGYMPPSKEDHAKYRTDEYVGTLFYSLVPIGTPAELLVTLGCLVVFSCRPPSQM